MKNILGVHGKIRVFGGVGVGGGGVTKSQYMGGLPKKGGLGQFADLREGGVGKKEEGGVLEGRLMPQCALCMPTQINFDQLLIL